MPFAMFKRFYILFVLVLCMLMTGEIFAQTTTLMKKADDQLNDKDYYYALENYLKVYDKKPNDPTVIEKILMCNQFLRNYNDMLTWSEQLVRLDASNPQYRLAYASALHTIGKYKEAKAAYQVYLKSSPTEKGKVDLLIRSCDSALKWLKRPYTMTIQNVAALNTGYSDWGLTKFANGYMFSSDRKNDEAQMILTNGTKKGTQDIFGGTGRPYLKLYYVNLNGDSSWTNPAFFSKLITERYHTSSASFDDKNNILYFSRTRKIDIPKSFNKSSFQVELVYSEAFREVKSFPYNSILNYSIGDPCVTNGGKRLYFASNMPGGYGGSDLYYCDLKNDGTWTKPANLGPEVNTAGQERYPSVVGDSVLYFSSDGYIGMGGLDIYTAYRNAQGGWSGVRNMGPPINSAEDDFSVIITKSTPSASGGNSVEGFFSSDRPGGKGSDDIYSFKSEVAAQPKNAFVMQGKITNQETGEGVPDVKLAVKETSSPEPVKNLQTDSSGTFKFEAKKHKKYAVAVKRAAFFAKKDTISADDAVIEPGKPATLALNVKLEPMVINKSIRLDNIYYKFNEWSISPQAAKVLDGLVSIMTDNPEIDIELGSHTDTRGDAAINKYISQMRAQAAVSYLISNGVDGHRIYAKGYGKEIPLVNCGGNCSAEDHARNRRTEFKIVKIQEQAAK